MNYIIRPSLFILVISGILILLGIPDFWTGNYYYWLGTRLLYGIGMIMFWFDR